jgi:hypothetical protein
VTVAHTTEIHALHMTSKTKSVLKNYTYSLFLRKKVQKTPYCLSISPNALAVNFYRRKNG